MHFPKSDYIIDLDSPLFQSNHLVVYVTFLITQTHSPNTLNFRIHSSLFSRTCASSIPWHRVIKHDDFIRLLSIIHNTQTHTFTSHTSIFIHGTQHHRYVYTSNSIFDTYIHYIPLEIIYHFIWLHHTCVSGFEYPPIHPI